MEGGRKGRSIQTGESRERVWEYLLYDSYRFSILQIFFKIKGDDCRVGGVNSGPGLHYRRKGGSGGGLPEPDTTELRNPEGA